MTPKRKTRVTIKRYCEPITIKKWWQAYVVPQGEHPDDDVAYIRTTTKSAREAAIKAICADRNYVEVSHDS